LEFNFPERRARIVFPFPNILAARTPLPARAEEKPLDAHERRRQTRVDARIALRFRPVENLNVPEQKGESENISPLGVYFTTDFPLAVGSVLVMWMTMPAGVTASDARDVRCLARVMHAAPTGRLIRKIGVGVRIESFAAAARAERWAS
jgi:hypothetical protein